MYVICIDSTYSSSTLTKGRIYKAHEEVSTVFWNYFTLVNDHGELGDYSKGRFKIIKDNRINKLLYKEIK